MNVHLNVTHTKLTTKVQQLTAGPQTEPKMVTVFKMFPFSNSFPTSWLCFPHLMMTLIAYLEIVSIYYLDHSK